MNTVVDQQKTVGELPAKQLAGLESWGNKVGVQVQSYQDLSLADLVQALKHMTEAKKESYKGPRKKITFA